MEKVSLQELVKLLEQELVRVGYKEATLSYYRVHWKKIVAHFERKGEIFFFRGSCDGVCEQ